ncbi:RNA polymerase sigma factor [Cohnella rhizosphaerae]|uniref:Sigma-70 family RNA polymerase sigma factor n=1 Tax=Cohnella rhizosphaerae TaxID=1457232 RepID=A0A9X4L492_9BACL|nr:sigma-70 family RNA polymerase sigma factor [Cohnella rhizosphaerae]MDG0813172.1 sigma-70 family RNA polymerase sigma factor [Cohnella rhizosphaerae]
MAEKMEEGDPRAFEKLYEQAVPCLLPLACHMLGDRMEAEDVVHDVLLGVIRSPGRYDPSRGSAQAWLAVQVKSRCLDRLRKRNRTVLRGESEEAPAVYAPAAQPETEVLARMEREAVRSALRQLPGVQREALAAAYFTPRSHKELADAWQVPLGTVKSRVRYGLGHLRKALDRMGWGAGEGGDGHA